MLVGDHLALDFLNSTAAFAGARVEWLTDGDDLLAWLARTGALADDALAAARDWNGGPSLEAARQGAVELREWFRDAVRRRKEQGVDALTKADLGRLNAVLARGMRSSRIEREGGALVVRPVRHVGEPADLLAPVAEAMADLVSRGDFDLIRRCEGPACTLWFYDRTKSHKRRWCSMAACGNRAKAASHRQRKRSLAG